ncbi:MAG: VacJ family lipoprotein [Desulfobacteraceae bacterium]|nr:MAG: VacJ family lipoprotein [Desulfobacteraceae bacterium]
MRKGFLPAVVLLIAVWGWGMMFPPAADAQQPPAADAARDSGASIDAYDEDDDDNGGSRVPVSDPLEVFNRDMFIINDFLILFVLEPAAKGVKAVVPWEFRTIFRNALNNIRFPVRFVNSLLQGNWEKSGNEFASFFLNTTVGFLGMADVASIYPSLKSSPEDMGQTFGVWGWEESTFLTLPFFGPSTVRDALGKLPDAVLDPLFWYGKLGLSLGIRGGEAVNDTTCRIGHWEALKKASLDPYIAVRNGFLQNRARLIGE